MEAATRMDGCATRMDEGGDTDGWRRRNGWMEEATWMEGGGDTDEWSRRHGWVEAAKRMDGGGDADG